MSLIDSPGGGGFQNKVATILPGSVDTDDLADGAVTSVKISTHLQSDNWDGTTVAAKDATQGWRIEKDTGDIGANDAVLRGSLTSGTSPDDVVIDGGIIKLGSGDYRIVIDPSTAGLLESPSIEYYSDNIQIGRIYGVSSGGAAHSMVYSALNGADHIFAGGDVRISNNSLEIIGDVGKADIAVTDQGTIVASGLSTSNLQLIASQILIPDGPSDTQPGLAFSNDTGNGIRNRGSLWDFLVGGSRELIIGVSQFYAPAIGDATTGAAANVFIEGSGSHRMFRSTSSLKYKPDWQYADEENLANLDLPAPIIWTDNEGGEMLGFGTEHIAAMLPAATQDYDDDGRPENYDTRSLVAILSAKVKRLERAVL